MENQCTGHDAFVTLLFYVQGFLSVLLLLEFCKLEMPTLHAIV